MFKLFIAIFIAALSQAAVWNSNQSWSIQYEEEYQEWMKSSAVHKKLFIDPSSPYYGIKADCADAAYALRAIFSFENSLPFAIKNPSGSRDGKYKTINNSLDKWDSYGSPNKRLVAMINTIGSSVGSESLTHFDTYPIKLSSINAGSLFTYKIRSLTNFIRHVYTIKDVNAVGTFNTIYSTQAIKAAGEAMTHRESKEFVNLPHDPWGFRRFRWPEHIGVSINNINEELDASNEQFAIADKMGKDFFKYVKNLIKTKEQNPEEELEQALKAVCEEATARIKYVSQAIDFQKQTGNKCMDYRDYDTYSTPARDKQLKEAFLKLKELNDNYHSFTYSLLDITESIFGNKVISDDDLNAACSIKYASNKEINLRVLWQRLNAGKISSHPNDTLEARWGEDKTPRTKCKVWY